MPYCNQCGTASNPAAKYCHECGNQLQLTVESLPTQSDGGSTGEPLKPVSRSSPIESIDAVDAPKAVAFKLATSATQAPAKNLDVHHPWRRLFARMVDMALATPFLYILLFYPIGENPFVEWLLGTDAAVPLHGRPFVIGILITVIWAPIEAAFLSAFGTTFGKWAFGIRVLGADGNRISYGKALHRACAVLMYGVGFGIPLVNLIAGLVGYHMLKKAGTTSWDRQANTSVSHRPWTPIGAVACAFAVLIFLVSAVLMPVVVATLDTSYWASRANLTPLANSPKAAPSVNDVDAASKQAEQAAYYACLTAWPDKHPTEWKRHIKEGTDDDGNYGGGRGGVTLIFLDRPDVNACSKSGLTLYPSGLSGVEEFRLCIRDWQDNNRGAWARFVKANKTPSQ